MQHFYKQMKQIDNETKNLVFGFIRQKLWKHISNLSNTYGIPELIIYICLTFYYIPESFGICPSHVIGILSNRTTIIKYGNKHAWNNTTYGHRIIHSNSNSINKWKIKINTLFNHESIVIGFTSNNNNSINYDFSQQYDVNYAWTNKGKFLQSGNVMNRHSNCKFSQGDIIILTLDLRRLQIIYELNDSNKKHCVENIAKGNNIKYQLAVSMYHYGDSISIIDHWFVKPKQTNSFFSNLFGFK
eukprot:331454_1